MLKLSLVISDSTLQFFSRYFRQAASVFQLQMNFRVGLEACVKSVVSLLMWRKEVFFLLSSRWSLSVLCVSWPMQQQMRKSCLWAVGAMLRCDVCARVCVSHCVCNPLGLWLMTSQSPVFPCPRWDSTRMLHTVFRNRGWEEEMHFYQKLFFNIQNTLPVTAVSVESWELITSKGKCVKLGLKHEEVVHLFINRSSLSEVGLDAFFPWVQSRWKPPSPVGLLWVKVWADLYWQRIYLLGGNSDWLR